MKGMIFTEFLDMVGDRFGLAVKDRVINAAGGAHDGAYTAVGNYDHREMVAMAQELSAATQLPLRDLLIAFGRATWPHLMARAMLAEQLWRATSILANHPYHREG